MSNVDGVSNEDRSDLSKAESRQVRQRSLRLLGQILKPLRGVLVLSAIVTVVTNAAAVVGPSIIAYGIDAGIPAAVAQDWRPVIIASVGYIVIGLFSALTGAWSTILTARIAQAALYDLRGRMFRHTQRLSISFHESYTSGRIISRQTSDLDAISELFGNGLSQLVNGVLFMTFTLIAMTIQDFWSGMILVVTLVPLFILGRWFQLRSQVLFRESRVTSARLIVNFVETMTGIRAVKAFRRERENDDTFTAVATDYRDNSRKSIRLFGTLEPAIILIGNVALAAVLLSGSIRALNGDVPVGVLLASLIYVRQFYGPAQNLVMFYNSYQSAAAALEKISGVLEERPSVANPTTPIAVQQPKGAIRFADVSFAYGEKVVLPDLELDIPAGQTVALVGTTGAGKTTLAKLISRFYDPTAGTVSLDGVDLRKLAPGDLRSAIVMVTQDAYLFSGSVADNIGLGKPSASRDEIQDAARAVGAHDFITKLPDGYDTEVNTRGGRVSAGQRQLISFARAFLANPRVLILDEATSSLDLPSERIVQHGLQSLLADRTAVIIAHRLSTVAIADRVLVMEHGRIIEDGTPDELIGGDGKFAKLHKEWRDSLA